MTREPVRAHPLADFSRSGPSEPGQAPRRKRADIRTRGRSFRAGAARTGLLLFLWLSASASGASAQKEWVEETGDVLRIAIPAIAFTGTLAAHDRDGTVDFLESFLATLATTQVLKLAVARDRPDGSDDNSFPSGHASASFQGASFLHRRYGWTVGLPAYLGASFVAYSRVYDDKHYVSDVVAGAALGTLSAFLLVEPLDRVEIRPRVSDGVIYLQVRVSLGRPPRLP